MQRTLEPVPRGDAHRSPAAAPKKRLAILVSALGVCLTHTSPADAAENPGSISFQYLPPAGPDKAFSLRYQVPPGFETAVLASVSPPFAEALAEGSPSHGLDLSACLLIPLPVDQEAGAAALDGVLPGTVTGEYPLGARITLHLVLFERCSGECLISDPIALSEQAAASGGAPSEAAAAQGLPRQAGPGAPLALAAGEAASEQPAQAPAGGESPLSSQGAAGQDAKGSASSGGGGTYASTSGRDDSNASSYSKPGWGGSIPGNAFIQLTPLLAFSGAITATLSHDQPAPVQGSGH
ncbi:MAG: hypothetical protein HY812_17760 [Planctomycetes bacterium]|nr:hypothetical protein [Planctomycetota bacterium]